MEAYIRDCRAIVRTVNREWIVVIVGMAMLSGYMECGDCLKSVCMRMR
jgi:hypothetical protein